MNVKASSSRKCDGWAPVLEFADGGRIVGSQRLACMEDALQEASELIWVMSEYPLAFAENIPAPNQCIDLSDTNASN